MNLKKKPRDDSNLAAIVGENLKRVRLMRKLSLEDVSAMSSVSRSMLSDIERGAKSPTIAVLHKICKGIHVSFNSLLREMGPDVEVVRMDGTKELIEHGNMEYYLLYGYDIEKSMEIQKILLRPGRRHESDSHGNNVWEYVMVLEGVFMLSLESGIYRIGKGESLRFRADRHHVYANETEEEVWLYNITYYGS